MLAMNRSIGWFSAFFRFITAISHLIDCGMDYHHPSSYDEKQRQWHENEHRSGWRDNNIPFFFLAPLTGLLRAFSVRGISVVYLVMRMVLVMMEVVWGDANVLVARLWMGGREREGVSQERPGKKRTG
jgi:hypothetical protein